MNTPEMFQVKIGCELKLAADNDHATLVLKSNLKLFFCQNSVEVLKMRYWYVVINLFVVQVPVLGVLKNVLQIYCHRISL